jgi:hypothetical protein
MRLAEFIREHRHVILSEWEATARRARPALGLERPALLDGVPALLDSLVIGLESDGPSKGSEQRARAHADMHALDRLDHEYVLSDVVHELALLRVCVLTLWQTQYPVLPADEAARWASLMDQAIERSAQRFYETRTRILNAFEQIADAAFNIDDLDAFLQRLVEIFADFAPSIDSTAILLREGDRLRVRATTGLEPDLGADLRVGKASPASLRKPSSRCF